MSAHEWVATAVPVFVALAAFGAVPEGRAPDDTRLGADLRGLARRSIFFGHQSVGMNLLDGITRIVKREGDSLAVRDVTGSPSVSPGVISHAFEPENGKPEMKLQGFARDIEALSATPPDLALLKFCYADFGAGTDVQALFARYQSTLANLRVRHPGITFVHVTVPLTRVQGGFKAQVKRFVGGTPGGVAENARRDDYNQLMRNAYQGREPLFDLAAVESTRPNGTRETVDWKGRAVPVLVEAYASDFGHLNETGQDRAARSLLGVLASARP
jgi:hypothetical protein